MTMELTKVQKQILGVALSRAGHEPAEFVFTVDSGDKETTGAATLVYRETNDILTVHEDSSSSYDIEYSIPGTSRTASSYSLTWEEVANYAAKWASRVKQEQKAIDPWAQETEGMADDDSPFTLSELPKVDKAIDESLEYLKKQALENNNSTKNIEAELSEVKQLLKKAARNSTKREWINLFRGVIISKLLDWGLQAELFHQVLHTLITSAHEVVQLAEHASHMLPT